MKTNYAMVLVLSTCLSGCGVVGIVGYYKNKAALEQYCELPNVGASNSTHISAKSLYISYEVSDSDVCFYDSYGALLESGAFEAIEVGIKNSHAPGECLGPSLGDGIYKFSVHEMSSEECSGHKYVELSEEKCISAEKINRPTAKIGYEYASSRLDGSDGYTVNKLTERVFNIDSGSDLVWITDYSVSKSSSWCPASGHCYLSCKTLASDKFGSYRGGWRQVVRPTGSLEEISSRCLKSKKYSSKCKFNL